ncbi:MAG: MlrC C-terminal domain-containing protein, partial [Persicimonas sp.]
VGEQVTVTVGAELETVYNTEVAFTGEVLSRHDTERYGKTVVLRDRGIHLIVSERPTNARSPDFFHELGLRPGRADVVVVKNLFPFRFTFLWVNRKTINVMTPGTTSIDVWNLEYERIPRPIYPLDEIDDKEPPEHLVTVELAPERDEDRLSLAWTEDEEGDDLEEIRPDDDGEEAILCNQEVEEESLQLEVRQLDVERDDQGPTTTFDYKLDVVDVGEEEGMEIEPNDERDEADKLTADDPRTGYIARSNDVDVYAFGVPYPEEVDEEEASDEDEETDEEADSPFDFADGDSDGSQDGSQDADEPRAVDLSVSSHPLDLGFEVLDDEGGLVAEVDRSAPGGKESVGLDLPPGLYYVVVEADRGSSCEPYEVDVSFGDEE